MSTVRVRREGGRGYHLISKAKYDADPKAYVRVDDMGYPIDAREPTKHGSGGDDLEAKTVAELRALAADRDIDLGDATKKADIIAVIEAAAQA